MGKGKVTIDNAESDHKASSRRSSRLKDAASITRSAGAPRQFYLDYLQKRGSAALLWKRSA